MTAPTVFFIDDSATMREVIKIAFRRENIDVVACHDGESALSQMSQHMPDVVISDVIMPGKDGYEVCQTIKQNPSTSNTPVVLMSGVVNRQVAEKAFAVKADELIRKPFQPQDLITRVKQLLKPGPKQAAPAPAPVLVPPVNGNGNGKPAGPATLSSIFATSNGPRPQAPPMPAPANPPMRFGNPAPAVAAQPAVAPAAAVVSAPVSNAPGTSRIGTTSTDLPKLRIEILRLEHLVKKLQSELVAEREYARALEEHIKTLQDE